MYVPALPSSAYNSSLVSRPSPFSASLTISVNQLITNRRQVTSCNQGHLQICLASHLIQFNNHQRHIDFTEYINKITHYTSKQLLRARILCLMTINYKEQMIKTSVRHNSKNRKSIVCYKTKLIKSV